MPARSDAVLRAANAVLRLLVVLNLAGGVVFALTLAATVHPAVMAAIAEGRSAEAAASLATAARLVLVIVLVVVPLAHVLLTRLREMVATVEAGDPFVRANAARLRTIAWCLLGIQLCDLAFGIVTIAYQEYAEAISGWTFSLTGWIAVLLLFVLARVFRQGTRMRADLARTV